MLTTRLLSYREDSDAKLIHNPADVKLRSFATRVSICMPWSRGTMSCITYHLSCVVSKYV